MSTILVSFLAIHHPKSVLFKPWGKAGLPNILHIASCLDIRLHLLDALSHNAREEDRIELIIALLYSTLRQNPPSSDWGGNCLCLNRYSLGLILAGEYRA
ncbi:hypothetical protein GDO78_001213 [Eleutherodactylus coqui]|uniref:Uncharacterized protein n=1 Tax=Eleutherodactylus coqui TaxID=57060 RepID=A0A8J6KI91_ELECQ|nr:hypothetical protein GDO78_001213 [Eleutherodactylus coqui]